MNKRKSVGLAGLVIFSICTIFFFASSDGRFNESQFEKIKEGMTESEVVAILGVGAGDYRPKQYIDPGHFVSISDPIGFITKESGLSFEELAILKEEDLQSWVNEGMPQRPRKVREKEWLGKTWGIVVVFDEKGIVIQHRLLEIVPPRPPNGFFEKLKWYFGL
jgi:hypothetical protein